MLKDYRGRMGNGSILPMQQPFPVICTPSAIYLSRSEWLGITYNVHTHMNCDAWNLRADDCSDSLSCCLPMRMNTHLDLRPQLGASNYKHTHTGIWLFRSVLTDLWKEHAKGLQTHLFAISSIPACTGAWRGPECRNNWAKCGENEQDECIGAKGGGLSLGSDAASKSKLKRSSILHHFRRWRLGSSFMWLHVNMNQLLKGKDRKTHTFESAVDGTTTMSDS